MANAKHELTGFLNSHSIHGIKCANIEVYTRMDEDIRYSLKEYHTEKEYRRFLESLNFEYDSGFGSQQLFGTVWLSENRWMERHEYNGSESWELMSLPEIPSNLKDIQREREKNLNDILNEKGEDN